MSSTTIFARASGGGRAGVSVYRLSGPDAGDLLVRLTGKRGEPRLARRVLVKDDDGLIDDGLALWFPGPQSFTGEDVVELHLHGSLAVERRLAEALQNLGAIPAGPGEFTLRAFANGKMDLTQAEGLADLLEAETILQHKQAMAQMRGALREAADEWRRDLIQAMAMLDAAVDFPDEEDVPGAIAEQARPAVDRVRRSLSEVLAGSAGARRVQEGIRVAIIGPPNAGKSTLFNKIVDSERAIVSAEAGTTRDTISERLDIAGHLVTLIDTAGIRSEGQSAIELEGIKRAEQAAASADLRLIAWPAGAGPLPQWLSKLEEPGDLRLATRADEAPSESDALAIASSNPSSIAGLLTALTERLDDMASPGLAATERQRTLLSAARDLLDGFGAEGAEPEVLSEKLRAASRRLEELTGRIAPDDILDDIFSSFCIGK